MTADQVNEWNAHRYADNYSVIDTGTDQCVGCEHNESEAKALCAWLNGNKGGGFEVRKNGPDLVRAAQASRAARGLGEYRHRAREEAFRDMGLWPAARCGR